MYRKRFQIFKCYRKREYERDLDRLKNKSGLKGPDFIKEAKWLKGDYEDEMAMEEEESKIFDQEATDRKKERKNQIRTNRIIAGATIITLLIINPLTIYFGIIQPEREERMANQYKIEQDILKLYRTIVANEDIFISNINELRDFIDSSSLNNFPYNYIEEDINLEIQDELQNKIGLINYRFLLYYIEQTNLLNNTIDELRLQINDDKVQSIDIIEKKKFYQELMDYLSYEEWEKTKFNYQLDTGCLLKILQEAFPYISDQRTSTCECQNQTLNRIYYYFDYYEVDTPDWMKSKYREALQDRGVDAWWID